MRPTNPSRTRAVLDLVFKERQAQEARYGEANKTIQSGSGPETRWLAPYTGASAAIIQLELRDDYEDFEDEVGAVTWVHLVREEIAEAFQETDPARLAEELVQVAALCVSWVERLEPDALYSLLPGEGVRGDPSTPDNGGESSGGI